CFFFQAEDGIRDKLVTGVQTCALPIFTDPTSAFGSGGTVMWLRSTPIRKAVVGSVNPVHAPVVSGPWQTERSPNPIPRAGVKTSPTPFFRSNARDQPPRSTVFLFPRSMSSGPPEPGFQAKARRGPKFV